MRDVRVSDAIGPVLDWMVAKCEGYECLFDDDVSGPWLVPCEGYLHDERPLDGFRPSANWSRGGPIIEREGINLNFMQFDSPQYWTAHIRHSGKVRFGAVGPTPLIAAMRCYVASKLGDIVKVPKEMNHG